MDWVISENVQPRSSKLYTDELSGYVAIYHNRRDGEAQRQRVPQPQWRILRRDCELLVRSLKRALKGTYDKMSGKHLQRYVNELAEKHNIRDLGTLDQMLNTVASPCRVSTPLRATRAIAKNGLSCDGEVEKDCSRALRPSSPSSLCQLGGRLAE